MVNLNGSDLCTAAVLLGDESAEGQKFTRVLTTALLPFVEKLSFSSVSKALHAAATSRVNDRFFVL